MNNINEELILSLPNNTTYSTIETIILSLISSITNKQDKELLVKVYSEILNRKKQNKDLYPILLEIKLVLIKVLKNK